MGNTHEESFNKDETWERHNHTHEDTESSFVPSHWVLSIIAIVLCCFIILENLLVLVYMGCNKRLRSAMYIVIGNLALSDLFTSLVFMTLILLSFSPTANLTLLQFLVLQGGVVTALAASVFSLLAIAVERLVAVAKPWVDSSKVDYRIMLGIGACWVTAAVIGSLPVMGWKCNGDFSDCSTVLPLCSKRYVLFVAIVLILVLLLSAGLCGRACCMVRSGRAENAWPRSLAFLKMVAVVLGACVVFRLPALIILLADAACPAGACPVLYQANYFFFFTMFHSVANLIIYTLGSMAMCAEVLRTLCLWWGGRRAQPPSHTKVPLPTSSSLNSGGLSTPGELPMAPLTRGCTTSL